MRDGKRKRSGRITSQAIVDRHSRIRRLLISYSYHGMIEIVPGCEDQCDNDDRSYRCRWGDRFWEVAVVAVRSVASFLYQLVLYSYVYHGTRSHV